MSKIKKLPWLRPGDYIVTAYAQRASGPGWSNTPLWVIVMDESKKLRQECIQPAQQDDAMRTLYNLSEQAHIGMRSAVAWMATGKKR